MTCLRDYHQSVAEWHFGAVCASSILVGLNVSVKLQEKERKETDRNREKLMETRLKQIEINQFRSQFTAQCLLPKMEEDAGLARSADVPSVH